MSKSYRIRTQVGVDKSLKVMLEQDFEFLEILSLKILQSQIYTRPCSDYGVIVGRVTVNDGFGVPNVKVSVFIPLDGVDEANPIITEIYPYKNLTDGNEDGYRYNLLPYEQQHSGHVPTGTFFDREDVLTNPTIIEVYDKYFKYTARTNDSGDYMIFGVPVGAQTIHIDCDLSDIGEFSLSPQDLIRMGIATESQVAGTKFKSSTNLGSLPQIISINKTIEVEPLWGQPEICNLGITRTDFDLTSEANIDITPTAIFMGSIISDENPFALKRRCKPKFKQGELCNMVTGPGEILAIRQTIIPDANGRPILETVDLASGGQVIDDNGTWLLDVPMNLDYVVTNEFGEQVLSNDPKKGIPTKGKYRFKVKWNQSPSLSENIKRGYFLVPNIREYGWDSSGNLTNTSLQEKSYAFSIDWNDYADAQSAIDCDDTFYPMKYNKVYTVSQMIDQYRRGTLPPRIVSVKNILDDKCESDNNKFPTNDSSYRIDILFLLFYFAMFIFRPIIYVLLAVVHVLAFVLWVLKTFGLVLFGIFTVVSFTYFTLALIALFSGAWPPSPAALLEASELAKLGGEWLAVAVACLAVYLYLKDKTLPTLNLPILLYDSCEFCNCKDGAPIEISDENMAAAASSSGGGSAPPPTPVAAPPDINVPALDALTYNSNTLNATNQAINGIMQGIPLGQVPYVPFDCGSKTPTIQTATIAPDDYYFFSPSLTLAERINLFNTKAKYFDSSIPSAGITNPGGGVNQIQVKVEPGITANAGQFHNDNVVVLLIDQQSLGSLTSGMLISFQDRTMSSDPNLSQGAVLNQFGNYAVTGTTSAPPANQITLNYTKPDLTPSSATYEVPGLATNNYNFITFPSDIEYLQVVTAMTYSNFNSQCSTSLPNSLNSRFLNNNMYILQLYSGGVNNNCATIVSDNPLTSIDDFANLGVVIMVRGVDPYCPKVNIEYDLSKIFGFSSFGTKIISGQYRLNVPIQGGFLNVDHDGLLSNTSTDAYSSMNLYYDTFNFQPDSTIQTYSSSLPYYYSNLDKNSSFTSSCVPCLAPLPSGFVDTTYAAGIRTTSFNDFTNEWNLPIPLPCTYYTPTPNSFPNNRGYFPNEIVEGGSLMILNATIPTPLQPPIITPVSDSAYFSYTYNTTSTMLFDLNILANNRKLVMRSDRLPSSTVTNPSSCGNNFLLQQNSNLGIYIIGDNGFVQSQPQTGAPSMSAGPSDNDPVDNFTSSVLDSLNDCGQSRNLGCYDFIGNDFVVNSGPCQEANGKQIFNNGCYLLVTKPIISLPNDWKLLAEWTTRTIIAFAACRNIWSHLFTNNWINGTLYAFAFKNDRFFTPVNTSPSNPFCPPTGVPCLTKPNQGYSLFCTDVIYYHDPSNNFYYRSSPYDNTTGLFVGRNAPSSSSNVRNLGYPTTLMDLGPRNEYIQELVMSDEFDGYVVNKVPTTTFGDVSDILNIFILSRLVNLSVINQIIGGGGADVFTYFSRPRRTVDGDYAQLISINSELGVAEFDSGNYPAIPGPAQDPIYFNGGNWSDGIIGIFYSSDTQVRDFITPKRTIINPNVSVTNVCAFNNIPVFSQEVPFYQWDVKVNPDQDSIFGSQFNDWYTTNNSNSTTNGFFSNEYQSMDRLLQSSNYFRGQGSTSVPFKGYIYSVDAAGNYDPNPASQQSTLAIPRVISVGGPFHFYFGLKKGKSAWDRFARKWINFEIVVD